MFDKDEQTRVNDSLNAIRNAPDLTLPIRNDIATFIATTFPRLSKADKLIYQQLSSGMSVKGNIGGGVTPGNAAQREQRRAIYLLWKAMGKTVNDPNPPNAQAATAMTLQPMALAHAFSDAMLKAAVVSSAAGAAYVFQTLVTHPARFIREHKIFIHGSTLGKDKFTAAGGNYQNNLNFNFHFVADKNRFDISRQVPPGYGHAHPFNAVSVPALHWSEVQGVGASPGNFANVRGCELTGGPTFMVTTQFTGCSFCLTHVGGVFRAAHISPAGDVNKTNYAGDPNLVPPLPAGGLGLARRLMANGAMVNAGGALLQVFGNGAGNAPALGVGNSFYPVKVQGGGAGQMKWTSIFGLVKGGNWRFYLQSVDGIEQIMPGEARRIF